MDKNVFYRILKYTTSLISRNTDTYFIIYNGFKFHCAVTAILKKLVMAVKKKNVFISIVFCILIKILLSLIMSSQWF